MDEANGEAKIFAPFGINVDFGEVFIPPDLDVPKPRVLPEFKRLAHALRSGNISVLDAKTFYIPNLHYDGAGPDAYFWVGTGPEPSEMGIKVPNEMGSLEPLRGYQGEDIEIQLPGNLTVYDIDWLAMWCVQYRHNFGHVMIPKDLDVPPALGQTKITPSWWYNPTSTTIKPITNTNCREFLDRRLQVRWEVQGDYIQIELSARIEEKEWAAFGLSGKQGAPQMKGADVTVIHYVSNEENFYATDYYLSDLAQCDGKKGACPDERIGGRNDAKVVRGTRRNGVTSVTFRRPLQTNEPVNDFPFRVGGSGQNAQSVIAAIGPLNSRREVNKHNIRDHSTYDQKIDFSATDDHQCTASLYELSEASVYTAWEPMTLVASRDTVNNTFTARIGPTGGKRGYTPITGHPSWGIAWYINDMLIPELYLERGQTYTFIVEGGNDRTNPARYHPFYICDSSEGGYGQKTDLEQMKQKVYAGVDFDMDGYPYPTAAGRYCEWIHKTVDRSAEFESFQEFKETLSLECVGGEPAVLTWTVPIDAPDLLYYQCYTHNNLGWKINIVDPGRSPRKIVGVSKAPSISQNASWPLAALAFIVTSLIRGLNGIEE
ncbi:protein Skeletor, isoforms B/C-like [Ctenocephalides felis]|uniref:protein Skeletor, isoforms B/C-like n=1 Tax=Ctenocephalides felis TaxID=7515 RepID=UPI000E6E256E|nr:protein Skeletor, isoforms B/C-like [Ctenocephalides felis]